MSWFILALYQSTFWEWLAIYFHYGVVVFAKTKIAKYGWKRVSKLKFCKTIPIFHHAGRNPYLEIMGWFLSQTYFGGIEKMGVIPDMCYIEYHIEGDL